MTLKDDFAAIFSASNAIPQGLSQIKQYKPEERYLLQVIRNAASERNCTTKYHIARIYQASLPISQIDARDPLAEAKARLIRVINAYAVQFSIRSMPDDVVPYKDGEFLTAEAVAEDTMVRVTLPTIYDAKGVICLGEWEPA